MRTQTDIKDIRTALKRLKPFTDSKFRLPIMGYIRLEARDRELRLTVPKMETGGISFTTATVPTASDEYTVCVNFADFRKIVDKIKADVTFTVSGHDLQLASGSINFKLNGKDPDNFPMVPESPDDLKASSAVSYGDIRSELEFVHTATDATSPNFTSGVLFDYTDANRLRLVGTDGHRLHSTYTVSRTHTVTDEIKAWLAPVEWVKAFNALKVTDTETVYLQFHGDDRMLWNIPTSGLSGKVALLTTPYPDYVKVIPDDCVSRFRLNVPETIETLNALSVIATSQDGRDMVVVNANGKLNLSARADSMGEASGTVNCIHLDGPDALFALNVHYLTETLKLADKRDVLMSNSGSLEPVRFDYQDTDRIAVVMPVRLPE